jgi:hypothetical protein
MVDPGAAQAIVKQLNRWYRSRARPHGTIDHYHRGTRMGYTGAYRVGASIVAGFLIGTAILFLGLGVTSGKSLLVVSFLVGIVAVAIYLLLQAFREFAIVTDEGLIRVNLFNRETRLAWREISSFRMKPDDNKVIFMSVTKKKLTMSLSYDGWQDFDELAARHLDPALYWQFAYALANVNAKRTISRSTKKTHPAKRFSFGRKR